MGLRGIDAINTTRFSQWSLHRVVFTYYLGPLTTADVTGHCQLCSANRGLLYFPRYSKSNYGRRAFSYAGPHAWNLLAENVRKLTSIDYSHLQTLSKDVLFEQIMHSAH